MKYVLILTMFMGVAHAEKERGGGSLDRLLLQAGATVSTEPKIRTTHDVKLAIFKLADRFLSDIRRRVYDGVLDFENFQGQKKTIQFIDLIKMSNAYKALKKEGGVTVRSKIESSRGDSIGFINNRQDMTLIVSETELERVMNIANPELAEGLGSAIVGHELLSLVGIEDSDNFPVSAALAEEVIWRQMILKCSNGAGASPTYIGVDPSKRQLKQLETKEEFGVDRITLDLDEPTTKLSLLSRNSALRVRLYQMGANYLLEFSLGEKLPGASETFFLMEDDRYVCEPLSPHMTIKNLSGHGNP